MTDPYLFNLPTDQAPPPAGPPAGDPPTCPLCRIRPIQWGVRKGDWARYCGGSTCNNTMRKCINCDTVLPRAEFRYVKYCSDECSTEAQSYKWHKGRRLTTVTCIRCGDTSETRKPTPHGWRDGRCSNCWRTRIGQDRMNSLVLHNVPWDMADHWAQTGWHCDLCGDHVSINRGVIDHDHDCCPGSRSCGKCVRGYLHPNCNIALGYLKNDPALLRAAADYLDRYQAQR